VTGALESYRYSAQQNATSPLVHLRLVTEHTLQQGLPGSPRMALHSVLLNLITEKYAALRNYFQLPPVLPDARLDNVERAIAEDGRTCSPALIGWSWLYHCYVRDELAITQEWFAAEGLVHVRSVRRYQDYVYDELVQELTERERAANQRQRRARLYAVLPSATPIRLIGRDAARAQLGQVLDGAETQHVQIVGPTGIGKSSFVQEVIRERIDQDRVDEVLWIDAPRSAVDIQMAVFGLIIRAPVVQSLHDYLVGNRIDIVVDGTQALSSEPVALQAVLTLLASATVFLIGSRYLALPDAQARVALRDLRPTEAKDLIRRELRRQFPEELFSDDEVTAIWEESGGNPQRVKDLLLGFHTVLA